MPVPGRIGCRRCCAVVLATCFSGRLEDCAPGEVLADSACGVGSFVLLPLSGRPSVPAGLTNSSCCVELCPSGATCMPQLSSYLASLGLPLPNPVHVVPQLSQLTCSMPVWLLQFEESCVKLLPLLQVPSGSMHVNMNRKHSPKDASHMRSRSQQLYDL